VGKSTMVANLGIALGKAGKTVLLVDLDLGGSNLHTCLGVNNPKLGLSQFIYKKVDHIEDLIVETPYPKVYLIAGDGLIPGTANIPFFIKRKLIKELQGMVADFVLLDLGAGTTNNTLDFFLMSPTAMLVTVPETTAILNAYSFLKSALYRALFRSYKAKKPPAGAGPKLYDGKNRRVGQQPPDPGGSDGSDPAPGCGKNRRHPGPLPPCHRH
jgi:flagellar biosynthesis protein FlhG